MRKFVPFLQLLTIQEPSCCHLRNFFKIYGFLVYYMNIGKHIQMHWTLKQL